MNDNFEKFITSEYEYKLDTLRCWLKKRNNVSLLQILIFLLGPSRNFLAKAYIKNTIDFGRYKKIFIRGIKDPLFFPKTMSMKFLYLVINELFYPLNFHYYESNGMSISSKDVVVDCGSSEGAFTLKIKDKCKQAYAIEPLPTYFKALKKTFANSKNVKILPFGLSNKKGFAWLANQDVCSRLTKSKLNSVKVELTTLDELFYKKKIPVSYLKIDVEGSDFLVLQGAINIIKKYEPKICVAVYHEANHAEKITSLIKKANPRYKIRLSGIHQGTGNFILLQASV